MQKRRIPSDRKAFVACRKIYDSYDDAWDGFEDDEDAWDDY